MKLPRFVLLLAMLCAATAVGSLLAGDPPPPRPVSQVAPAEDLIAQVRGSIETLTKLLADEKSYTDGAEKAVREANLLAVLALVLGMHDADHPLKQSAPALLAASQELAAAKDYAAAKAAFDKMQAAAQGSAGEGPELKWQQVAELEKIMKQVTMINARMRRGLRRFDRDPEQTARDAAVLAAIAQAVTYDTHEVKNPQDVDQWYSFCGQTRDAAGELNARIHARDEAGATAAAKKLAQACDACHKVFRPSLAE